MALVGLVYGIWLSFYEVNIFKSIYIRYRDIRARLNIGLLLC